MRHDNLTILDVNQNISISLICIHINKIERISDNKL